MKVTHTLVLLSSIIVTAIACSKSGSGYITADHTIGLANRPRQWSGTASGYLKGDSAYVAGDTTHREWPKAFSRTIADTTITIQKINGFLVSMLGTNFNYTATDSVAGTVKFDTLLISSSTKSEIVFYYSPDSISYEYHAVSGFNSVANKYYQVNEYLHTIAH